jgi:hypothetical protein
MSAVGWIKRMIARGHLRLRDARLTVRRGSYASLSDDERATLKQEQAAIVVTLLDEDLPPDTTTTAPAAPTADDIDRDADWGLRGPWKHLPREQRIFERNAQRIRRARGWEYGNLGIVRDGTVITHGLSNSTIDPTAEMLESLRRQRR